LASVENKATRRRTGESVSVDYDRILDRGVITDNVGAAADQRLRNTYSHKSQSAELASDSDDGAMRDDEFRHNDHGRGANGELTVFQWSLDGIRKAQREDKDIKLFMDWLQQSNVKPPWETVALCSIDVKTLWAQWPRLAVKDGPWKRRFESADGLSVYWQVVWPCSIRGEFLRLAHGGMNGGHFGRMHNVAAIQSQAEHRNISKSDDHDGQ